ncbi:MAG: alpha/beta hydrolase, partial [Bacteroidetes bacterium]|nr:alpha/beta hydrolase [Bacteroidota bacterium]
TKVRTDFIKLKKSQKKPSLRSSSGQQSAGNIPEAPFNFKRRGFLKTCGLVALFAFCNYRIISGNIYAVSMKRFVFNTLGGSLLLYLTIILLQFASFNTLFGAEQATYQAQTGDAKKPNTQNNTHLADTSKLFPARPTMFDVPYGKHPKQVLHYWRAKTEKPAPLLFYVHGGGWEGGNRMGGLRGMLEQLLATGISVVSIEYRFIDEAMKENIVPPVKGPMYDVARALQFVRSKALDWNIDKKGIVISGNSAGACTSLWLAFHDDLADPKSADPIARESTRLLAVAVSNAQTTLDPKQMQEWTPNSIYGGHAFGILKSTDAKTDFNVFFERRTELLPLIKEYSPYYLVSSDDPPVYLTYREGPGLGQWQKDPTHTSNFGIELQKQCQQIGIPCELVYPGAANVNHASVVDFVIEILKK